MENGGKRDSTDEKVWEHRETCKSEQSFCPYSLDARLCVTNCEDHWRTVCVWCAYIHTYT
jgi:hypothetical protein